MGILRAAVLAGAGIAALAGGAGAALLASPSLLTRTAEYVGSTLIGRNLQIGRVSIQWANPVRVQADDIKVSNAAWGSAANMASVSRIEAAVDPWSLLHGKLVVHHLRVTNPELLLEVSVAGEENWPPFARWGVRRPYMPDIHEIEADSGVTTFHNMATGAQIAIGLTKFKLDTMNSAGPPVFTMTGRIRTQPFRFAGTVGSSDEASAPSDPYPFKLKGELGDVAVAMEGTSEEPLRFRGTRVRFTADGRTLSEIGELIGLHLPQTPDFHASGSIRREQGDWSMEGFDARFGKSEFSGSATLDLAQPTPTLKMQIAASQLNLPDFRSLFVRMISDIRLPPEVLSEANADVSFEAERISGIAGLPAAQVTARVLLEHGVLQLARAEIGIAKGKITALAKYVPAQGAPTLYIESAFQRIDLHRLAASQAAPDLAKATSGNLEGSIQIRMTGATPDELLRHMNGDVGIFVQGGSVSALATASLQVDVLRTIGLAGSAEKSVRLNCLVSHLVLRDGVAFTSPVVLDTDDLTAVATGSINLGAETLALRFVPKAKHYHPLTISNPFSLNGSVWKPAIRSDSGPVSDLGSAIVSLIPSADNLSASAAHEGDGAVCSRANAEARHSPPRSVSPSRNAE